LGYGDNCTSTTTVKPSWQSGRMDFRHCGNIWVKLFIRLKLSKLRTLSCDALPLDWIKGCRFRYLIQTQTRKSIGQVADGISYHHVQEKLHRIFRHAFHVFPMLNRQDVVVTRKNIANDYLMMTLCRSGSILMQSSLLQSLLGYTNLLL